MGYFSYLKIYRRNHSLTPSPLWWLRNMWMLPKHASVYTDICCLTKCWVHHNVCSMCKHSRYTAAATTDWHTSITKTLRCDSTDIVRQSLKYSVCAAIMSQQYMPCILYTVNRFRPPPLPIPPPSSNYWLCNFLNFVAPDHNKLWQPYAISW